LAIAAALRRITTPKTRQVSQGPPARHSPGFANGALTVTAGFNNLFGEEPACGDACGVIGLSTVANDLTARTNTGQSSPQQIGQSAGFLATSTNVGGTGILFLFWPAIY